MKLFLRTLKNSSRNKHVWGFLSQTPSVPIPLSNCLLCCAHTHPSPWSPLHGRKQATSIPAFDEYSFPTGGAELFLSFSAKTLGWDFSFELKENSEKMNHSQQQAVKGWEGAGTSSSISTIQGALCPNMEREKAREC